MKKTAALAFLILTCLCSDLPLAQQSQLPSNNCGTSSQMPGLPSGGCNNASQVPPTGAGGGGPSGCTGAIDLSTGCVQPTFGGL